LPDQGGGEAGSKAAECGDERDEFVNKRY
jgi:hypothetical protein